MGKRGPKPKPTALKRAEGNPGRRTLRDGEPVPPVGPIAPPAWLNERAAAIWNELAPALITMQVLTPVDRLTFGRYCRSFARYLELQEFLWSGGPLSKLQSVKKVNKAPKIKGKDTPADVRMVYELPIASELRKLQETLTRQEDRFGLNPSARSGLQVGNASPAPEQATPPASPGGPFPIGGYDYLGPRVVPTAVPAGAITEHPDNQRPKRSGGRAS